MRRGLTLPELIVSMALLSLVSLLVYQLTWAGTRVVEGGEDRFTLNHELREAKRRIELIVSTACPSPDDPPVLRPDLNESAQQLRFLSMVDLLDTGASFDPENPEFIEYRLVLRQGELMLERADGLGSPERLCRGVTEVEYTNVNQGAVVVSLTIEGEVRNARNRVEIQSRSTRFSVALAPSS